MKHVSKYLSLTLIVTIIIQSFLFIKFIVGYVKEIDIVKNVFEINEVFSFIMYNIIFLLVIVIFTFSSLIINKFSKLKLFILANSFISLYLLIIQFNMYKSFPKIDSILSTFNLIMIIIVILIIALELVLHYKKLFSTKILFLLNFIKMIIIFFSFYLAFKLLSYLFFQLVITIANSSIPKIVEGVTSDTSVITAASDFMKTLMNGTLVEFSNKYTFHNLFVEVIQLMAYIFILIQIQLNKDKFNNNILLISLICIISISTIFAVANSLDTYNFLGGRI